jgi:hypothetical protein
VEAEIVTFPVWVDLDGDYPDGRPREVFRIVVGRVSDSGRWG